MSITTGGSLRLQTDIRGRFRHLDLGERHLRLELPAGPAGWIEIPGGKILHARLDGKALSAAECRLAIPVRKKPLILELFREGA
jgi:hypothetical protein